MGALLSRKRRKGGGTGRGGAGEGGSPRRDFSVSGGTRAELGRSNREKGPVTSTRALADDDLRLSWRACLSRRSLLLLEAE